MQVEDIICLAAGPHYENQPQAAEVRFLRVQALGSRLGFRVTGFNKDHARPSMVFFPGVLSPGMTARILIHEMPSYPPSTSHLPFKGHC